MKKFFVLFLVCFVASAGAAIMPVTVAGNVTTLESLKLDLAKFAELSAKTGATGDILSRMQQRVPAGSGELVVDVTAKIPKAKVVAALGRFLGKTLPILSTGKALYDLGEELGYALDNKDGPLVVRRKDIIPGQSSDPSACTVAPCFKYGPNINGPFQSSAQKYCDVVVASVNAQNGTFIYGPPTVVGNTCEVDLTMRSDGSFYDHRAITSFQTYSADPTTPTTTPPTVVYSPASVAEFLDGIINRTNWPENSKLVPAVSDAIAAGETGLEAEPSGVTGPSSTPGPSTTTNNTTNNSTTTNTATNNYTYGPNTVTVTTNNAAYTIDNSTGAVIATSQSVTTPQTNQPQKESITCGLPGTPACKIDEAGTPTKGDAADDLAKIAALKTEADRLRDIIAGKADKPFFAGWDVFFSAPAFVQCEPFVLPRDYGEINACPVVDGVRVVMGYLWALGALMLCLGMIKRTF